MVECLTRDGGVVGSPLHCFLEQELYLLLSTGSNQVAFMLAF